jgi:hypothetical protein
VSAGDKKLLERWLVLLGDRHTITEAEAGELRRQAWEAVLA